MTILLAGTMSLTALADEVTRSNGGLRVKAELSSQGGAVRSARIETVDQSEQTWSVSDHDTDTLSEVLAEGDDDFRFTDCNGNGINDILDLTDGADDANGNGVLDECEFAYGDLNLDGQIDGGDMFIVLGWFASPFPLFGDLNDDGMTNAADMGILLSRWGATPF